MDYRVGANVRGQRGGFPGGAAPGNSYPTTFLSFRDDTYMRDDLGVLEACDAMLMG
jgi:hypothetical protein